MSEAPHVEPNMSDYPDFDPSAPSNANSYTNGDTNIQNTKNTVLSSEVSDITTRPKLAETQLTLCITVLSALSTPPIFIL